MDDRGQATRRRIDELQRRQADLRDGRPSTQRDNYVADERLSEARERNRRAYLSAAAAHDRAAKAHDQAAASGVGDRAAHESAAARHRQGRDADYRDGQHAEGEPV
jgi:hypothetical protein